MTTLKLHTEKIDHTAPPEGVVSLSLNNKTPLSRSAGKLSFACPICYLVFERYACWAKRVNVNYCSRECACEGRKVRVHTNCVVCGADMEQMPSNLGRVVTCGKLCSSKRRQSDTPHPRNFIVYKKAIKLIAKREVCSRCGVRSGPWIVRDIESEFDDGLLDVDASAASLWCQRCHLTDTGPGGGRARQRQRKARGY